MDVINFEQVGCALPKPEIIETSKGLIRQRLCRNEYFTTERILLQSGGVFHGDCNGSSLEIWGVIEGEAVVAGQPLSAVRFVLLPARLGPFAVQSTKHTILLRTFTE
jgi:hypothetical protein